ncbi:MAG: glycerol-3-phosphate dehydrogenase/oxidase [Candidatus Sericytochromatia bacterium]
MNKLLPQEFSLRNREININNLKHIEYDLLIIGGGITGAGTACFAAQKGIKTALVDMNDFASGTSSKSSKLLHGGLRYLEQMKFKLVFESLKDRNDLFKEIPQIAKPLSFIVPVYETYKETVMLMNLGLSLYDLLSYSSGNMITKIHKYLNSKGVTLFEPNVRKNGLKGGIQYFDGSCEDARLTLENIKTASRLDVDIANYVKITGFEKNNKGKVTGAFAKDLISGESFKIKAKAILNATGPWIDSVNQFDNKNYENKLKPTKGVHIIVPKLTEGHTLFVKTPTEPIRWIFIIPYGNYSMVGTTDTESKSSENDHSYLEKDNYANKDEINYLLETINYYYPEAKMTEKDIISSFGGWRPLIAPPKDAKLSESDISREHEIFQTPSGIICIAGGKLTTFVSMAKEIVNYIIKKKLPEFKHKSEHYPRMISWNTNLNLKEYINQEKEKFYLEEHEIIEHLINKYGTEYNKIYKIMEISSSMKEKISNLSIDSKCYRAEILYFVYFEMATSLKDIMTRRTRILIQDDNQGIKAMEEIGNLMACCMADFYSWEEEYKQRWLSQQIRDYEREVEKTNSGIDKKDSLVSK